MYKIESNDAYQINLNASDTIVQIFLEKVDSLLLLQVVSEKSKNCPYIPKISRFCNSNELWSLSTFATITLSDKTQLYLQWGFWWSWPRGTLWVLDSIIEQLDNKKITVYWTYTLSELDQIAQ